MAKILIKGGRVIDPASNTDKKADILIEGGKIKQIKAGISASANVAIDASGLIVCPGFIDAHVHLREPGFEEKETIESGSKAAVAGGFTSILCMPNTKPVIDEPALVDFIIEKSKEVGLADIYVVAALTKNSEGQELSEMVHLADAGAVAFSDDGNNVDNAQVMRKALEYSKLADKPVLIHAEDSDLAGEGQVNEGLMATKLGLRAMPALAEEVIINRDIELAKITGAKVHFMHVSTAGSVELIRKAKKDKVAVTCEVTPHHLLLDDSMLRDFDTNLKVKPPIRSKKDTKALLKGLKDGTIDCIASDHAPHARHQKEVEFDYAAFGMVGLETLFGLVYTNFEKDLGLLDLIAKVSANPARIFGLEAGAIKENGIADITIINPKAQVKVDSSKFYSKSQNTPFKGWQLKGKIEQVIKSGRVVFKDGKVIE